MPFLFAGLASLTFGVADFVGGFATRRAHAVTVVTGSHVVATAVVLVAAPLVGDDSPIAVDWLWGAAAGLAGSVGLVVFYHALATTRVAVAAPMAAVMSTLTPVVFGIGVGERPSQLAWVGMVIAIPAMLTLPSASRGDEAPASRAAWLGGFAGFCFGLFGILISRTTDGSGLWPLLTARGASIVFLVIVVLAMRRPLLPPRNAYAPMGLAGLLDMTANIFFLLAVREELLSLVAVIMSFYPVSTIALARFVFSERLVSRQFVGLGLGAISVTFIALG